MKRARASEVVSHAAESIGVQHIRPAKMHAQGECTLMLHSRAHVLRVDGTGRPYRIEI